MCLIVDKKRNPRYIYKCFRSMLHYGLLYSREVGQEYKAGKNIPKQVIRRDVPIGSLIDIGALHAYTSYQAAISNSSYYEIIVRLPYDKDALIAFGTRHDVALKYINLPSIIYNRIIQQKKPDRISRYSSKVYLC